METVDLSGPRSCTLRSSPWVHARAAGAAGIGAIAVGRLAQGVGSSLARGALGLVAALLLVRAGRGVRRLVRRPPDFLLDGRGVTHLRSGRSAVTIPWAAIRWVEAPRSRSWPSSARGVRVQLAGGGHVHLPANVDGLPEGALEPILAAWMARAGQRSTAPPRG